MLKTIVLHSAAVDNAGVYHDAGSELAIGDDVEKGIIALNNAQALVDGHRAVSKTEAGQIERNADQLASEIESTAADAGGDVDPAAPPAPAELEEAEGSPKPRRTRAG
jgi:hypothetical protein